MIPVLQAAFLGVLQGLTEFIPVSSSGHLVLFPKLFGWPDPGLAFDVAVHVGTLLAVVVYFRREWWAVIKGFFTSFRTRPSAWDRWQRLSWLLILATIPAAVVGVALSGYLEDHLRSVPDIAFFLLLGSLAMVAAEMLGRGVRGLPEVRLRDSASMGLVQIAALAPGMSRSGITMSAGMVSGLGREAAARFSFMMAAPVIAGAGLVEAVKLVKDPPGGTAAGVLAAGLVTSAVVGFFTVKYLLSYLRRGSLLPFALYGFCLSFFILVLWAVS